MANKKTTQIYLSTRQVGFYYGPKALDPPSPIANKVKMKGDGDVASFFSSSSTRTMVKWKQYSPLAGQLEKEERKLDDISVYIDLYIIDVYMSGRGSLSDIQKVGVTRWWANFTLICSFLNLFKPISRPNFSPVELGSSTMIDLHKVKHSVYNSTHIKYCAPANQASHTNTCTHIDRQRFRSLELKA